MVPTGSTNLDSVSVRGMKKELLLQKLQKAVVDSCPTREVAVTV